MRKVNRLEMNFQVKVKHICKPRKQLCVSVSLGAIPHLAERDVWTSSSESLDVASASCGADSYLLSHMNDEPTPAIHSCTAIAL